MTKTQRLTANAVLSAVALVIFIVELQLPSLTPIPGIKLGLANIITLMTMFLLGPVDALVVLLIRILLGCFMSGQLMAFAYSIAGGMFSFLVMWGLKKLVTVKQIFVCSVFCAIAHNTGQILVAIVITQTIEVAYYLPVLLVAGIVAGMFTGLAAQFAVIQIKKLKFFK